MVSRIYVEKKPGFDVEAQQLLAELRTVIRRGPPARGTPAHRQRLRRGGISEELFERCVPVVFSEPQVDVTYRESPRRPGRRGHDRVLP